MTPTCSIIIPHYNQIEYLRSCLSCLQKQSYSADYEVLVVDNGTQETKLHDLKKEFPVVRWLKQLEANNPYVSRNLGIKEANSSELLFVDAKCQPDKEWLQNMMSKHLSKPSNIIAGRYQLNYQSDRIKDKVYGLLYLNNQKNVKYQYGVTAGNLLVTRSIFEKVGVFNTSHLSGRDILWSKMALSKGVEIIYADDAVVTYPSQTWDELNQKVIKYASGTPKESQSASLKKGLFNFSPLKMTTFRKALSYRGLDHLSFWNQIELWLRAWFIKAKYNWYRHII